MVLETIELTNDFLSHAEKKNHRENQMALFSLLFIIEFNFHLDNL